MAIYDKFNDKKRKKLAVLIDPDKPDKIYADITITTG